ncbi:MAG: cyclic nucleotide-binding/CBS domain-containing protein [Magnetococcales bacterium]|nr:cyclic nucleotide-binding/CBS domain-containing protein [Magnetococcales bacterium]
MNCVTIKSDEVSECLHDHPYFSRFPMEVLKAISSNVVRIHLVPDQVFTPSEDNAKSIYLIHHGTIVIHGAKNQAVTKLGAGELLEMGAFIDEKSGKPQTVIAKSLDEVLMFQIFMDNIAKYASNEEFVNALDVPSTGDRLRRALERRQQENTPQSGNFLTMPVKSLIKREPISMSENDSIRDVAKAMMKNRVSCMLLTKNSKLSGIVTDRDLRCRVLGGGVSRKQPVSKIMTASPMTIDINAYGFEVLMLMSHNNIHHVPVLMKGKPAGVITNTNMQQCQTTSSVFMVGDAYKRKSVSGLRMIAKRVPELMSGLVQGGASPHATGQMVTTVTDAINIRILQIAEKKLGPPPVPYAWMVAGSQGRQEQTALSDQDNCLVLDNAYDPVKHGDYFKEFSQFVCSGLNEAGYVFCPGDIMAQNNKWRKPLKKWKKYFNKWVTEPKPDALMNASTFFDLRFVHGEQGLAKSLNKHVRKLCSQNSLFLSILARNSIQFHPPLSIFKNLVLIKGGENDKTIDLKSKGIIPIVELARVYALNDVSDPVNTRDRLIAAADGKEISRSDALDLKDALKFISLTRLRHQARQVDSGQTPNNFLPINELSLFERNHLKDAFTQIQTMQSSLERRYNI